MIQNTVYFVLKGVDYFLQTRNEAKDLHVSKIFFKLGGLSGAAALLMAAYHEVGKYGFFLNLFSVNHIDIHIE